MANLFLNRGGAGFTIRREDTTGHLNPIIEALIALNHAYNFAIEHTADPATAAQLEAFQKIARVDVSKLAETVLSSGGVPYNGIDLEPADFTLSGDTAGMVGQLAERERSFLDLVRQQDKIKHHIRTQAILMNVRTNGEARLAFLDGGGKRRR